MTDIREGSLVQLKDKHAQKACGRVVKATARVLEVRGSKAVLSGSLYNCGRFVEIKRIETV